MNFFRVLVRKPVTVLMIIIIVLLFGTVSILNINQEFLPDISMPYLMISTSYPGASPEQVETIVTKPLEDVVSTVPNFKKVTSKSSDGTSTIQVEFAGGTNMDSTILKAREKIDMVTKTFPDAVQDPSMIEMSVDAIPVMQLVLSGGKNQEELGRIAENVYQKQLERIGGVARLDMMGNEKYEISVELIKERAEGLGVSVAQIAAVLRTEDVSQPAGNVLEGMNELSVTTTSELKSIEDVKNTVIQTANGAVKLSDIAVVSKKPKTSDFRVTIGDTNAVYINLYKQPDSSITELSAEVRAKLEEIKEQYSGVDYVVVFDQAEYIQQSLDSILESGVLGLVLALVILFLFLRNMRLTLIIGVAMPISIIASFILMYFSDISINTMSLFGLVLGIGMLVDNSVVVLENIQRYLEMGYDSKEASIKGVSEVAMAITASTLTTIAVFSPLLFMKDNIYISMFKEVGLTITYSLTASLVVALTLVPVTAACWLKADTVVRKKTSAKESFLARFYAAALSKCLGHKKLVIFGSLGAFLLSMGSFAVIGSELFPAMDSATFNITYTMPDGTSVDETKREGERVAAVAEQALSGMMAPDHVVNLVGNGGDNVGQLTYLFPPRDQRDYTIDELSSAVKKSFADYAGPKIEVSAADVGSMMYGGSSNQVTIKLYGDELSVLTDLSDAVEAKLQQIDGISSTASSLDKKTPELKIMVDRQRAANYGLSPRTIADTLKAMLQGSTAASITVDNKDTDLTVRLSEAYTKQINDIKFLSISNSQGLMIPLSELAELKVVNSPVSISREDSMRQITVTGTLEGKTIGQVTEEVKTMIKDIPVEAGYKIELAGTSKNMEDSMKDLMLMVVVAILLVYMIIACQFESLLHPLIIIFSIPLSIIGVALSLLLTGTPLSLPGMVGIVTLVGVVVNNAIVLIDFVNRQREDGMDMNEAVISAARIRTRPIFITTLTTVLGLLPVALSQGVGAERMQPYAIVVIGGLLFSTLLTLIVIPILYVVLESRREKRKKKKAAKKA